MFVPLVFVSIALFVALLLEQASLKRARKQLKYVVHVNGTRGKSTIVRLIDAGLRVAGQYKVFSKTTGTTACTIGVDGQLVPIKRKGRANISEQIEQVREAARQGADVLVIECMAIQPVLQKICEEKIVQADLVVISNVRNDHIPEMGYTLSQIAEAYTNTIPQNGTVFTVTSPWIGLFKEVAEKRHTTLRVAEPVDDLLPDGGKEAWPSFLQENISLALSVCQALGVDRQVAMQGMITYVPDAYAFRVYHLPHDILFANALSANDPESSQMIFRWLLQQEEVLGRKIIILINCRGDRPVRSRVMLTWALEQDVEAIWLLGPYRRIGQKNAKITVQVGSYQDLPFDQLQNDELVFAIGNMGDEGFDLVDWVRARSR